MESKETPLTNRVLLEGEVREQCPGHTKDKSMQTCYMLVFHEQENISPIGNWYTARVSIQVRAFGKLAQKLNSRNLVGSFVEVEGQLRRDVKNDRVTYHILAKDVCVTSESALLAQDS